MAAPLVHRLEDQGLDVTLGSAGPVDEVLSRPGKAINLLRLRRVRGLSGLRDQVRLVRAQNFSSVVLVNHSFRSAWLARLAGIPQRIGHATDLRRILLTHAVKYNRHEFAGASAANLALPLGIRILDAKPRLSITDEERLCGAESVRFSKAAIGIQPGARYPEKQIPLELLTQFVRHLQDQGHSLVFLGGPDEVETAARLAQRLPHPVLNYVGIRTLRETMGILSTLGLFVAGDTGLMHLAVGVGCPTRAVFGPTDAGKWGHDYSPHLVIQAPQKDIQQLDLDLLMQAVKTHCRTL